MLTEAKKLYGHGLLGTDGDIGKVKDFYFDDKFWTIRYLVADAGSWFNSKQVLISPYSVKEVIGAGRDISVNLSKKQITDSPSVDTEKPVSRQFETSYFGYYGWPIYWSGPYMWGAYPTIERDQNNWIEREHRESNWDPHLRSTQSVNGYHIEANDGEIGHVENFIIDSETWAIRYLVVDTKNWWPGKKVLIAPQWVKDINWGESKIVVSLSRDDVQRAAEYKGESSLTRKYEEDLYQNYHRENYWGSASGLNTEMRDQTI